jgi:FAD dependent oxidoreductase
VFPRADDSTHITALSDVVPLPIDPAAVRPDSEAIGRLQAIAERLSPVFRPERILARQACFRPVTHDGLPLIGKVPRSERLNVATGPNVWGILNSPATGEAIAELIADGAAQSVDLAPFDPIRLPALDPSLLAYELNVDRHTDAIVKSWIGSRSASRVAGPLQTPCLLVEGQQGLGNAVVDVTFERRDFAEARTKTAAGVSA